MAIVAGNGSVCVGVDVGGTFTDVVLSDGSQVWSAKAPTTPGALGRGVLDACRLVAERAGTTLEDLLPKVTRFGLGTTAVTNTIAARTGLDVGLITTRGFEDLVPIARGKRVPSDGWLLPPVALVDRERILGVPERVDRNGTVLVELDRERVREAGRVLVEHRGARSLAVSFLWSFLNDANERAAVAELAELFPGVPVMSGADLLPVIREYERTQFALLNAYTAGSLDGVVELADELERLGLRRPPLLVHSGAGSISVGEGRRMPALLAESGPAAGVVAALEVCRSAGITDAVTGDVGGTSFDLSFISGGEAGRRSNGELMGIWTAMPMVDIDSVGAGGGSIAWVDSLGILRVGPRSAGAEPGPACYGRGGTEATVTDALVVLGYLDPDNFLGGTMALDAEAARSACTRVGERLGLDRTDAAWGIWEVALASMARALRARFAERGVDPRTFAMLSMGGCGALFGPALARDLGIRRVLVPDLASVLSAFGAAASQVRRERSRSVGALLPVDPGLLGGVVEELTRAVRDDLAADGVAPGDITVELAADLRFHRQTFELPIVWDDGLDEAAQLRQRDRFLDDYTARYGKGAIVAGAPVELVTVRSVGLGRTARARLTRAAPVPAIGNPRVLGSRPVYLGRSSEPVKVPVYDRADLRPGQQITGPALIDAADTTSWVPPGAGARLDEFLTLEMEL
ncbi:hydantoinase/oxoprolinase family protein [Dactylosporangium sucinum]|uniref:5-oxoprolinase n=1 Tax=Dactylosporangium sucinum TaxID=1424081 RepID=A0A917UAX7_9ACTN|nr:hydantoinase/oxoprolinase family protein [Dactylosporangium sucinum]GGM75222.1 5-oxoprolinase [Dactylosporangium sucinum]